MATNAVLSACRPDQSTLQSPFTDRSPNSSSLHTSQLQLLKRPPVVVMVATRPPPLLKAKAMVATNLLAAATRLNLTRLLLPNTRHHPTLTRATSSPNSEATNSLNKATSSRDRAQPRLLSISSKAQGSNMVLLAAATEEEQQPSSLL